MCIFYYIKYIVLFRSTQYEIAVMKNWMCCKIISALFWVCRKLDETSSCLENPKDGGSWRAAVYGVTQSRTWLKWLSSKLSPNSFCSHQIYPHSYQSKLQRKTYSFFTFNGSEPWTGSKPSSLFTSIGHLLRSVPAPAHLQACFFSLCDAHFEVQPPWAAFL